MLYVQHVSCRMTSFRLLPSSCYYLKSLCLVVLGYLTVVFSYKQSLSESDCGKRLASHWKKLLVLLQRSGGHLLIYRITVYL